MREYKEAMQKYEEICAKDPSIKKAIEQGGSGAASNGGN